MSVRFIFKYIITCLLLVTFFSCEQKVKETDVLVKRWDFNYEDPAAFGTKIDENNKNNHYSHCDSATVYGYGLNTVIPDSLLNYFLKIKVKFKARLHGRRFGQSVVIAVQNQDKIHHWYSVDCETRTFTKNKWFEVEDSTQFFNQLPTPTGNELRVFGFNAFKRAQLDIDDLNIELIKVVYTDNK